MLRAIFGKSNRESNNENREAQLQSDLRERERASLKALEKQRADQAEYAKRMEHEREQQAMEAERKYVKEQQELTKKTHAEKIAFIERKINEEKASKAALDAERVSADAIVESSTVLLANNQKKLESYSDDKNTALAAFSDESGLDTARDEMDLGMKEINEAIARTGQQEENVVKFLALANSLSGATMETTAKSNTLEAQISTFGELVTRECRSKLSIAVYIEQEAECLKAFVPALNAKGFFAMNGLKCDDEKDFNGILAICEKAAEEEQKKAAETGSADANADAKDEEMVNVEEAAKEKSPEELFAQYKLSKFWAKFVEDGWDDPEDWPGMSDEELKEMGVKGGFKKKFRRMANNEGPEAEVEAESPLNMQQMSALKKICLKPETWQHLEDDQKDAAKQSLNAISESLSTFFTKIAVGVKQADALLGGYDAKQLSDVQRKVVDTYDDVQRKVKAIEAPTEAPTMDDVSDDEKEKSSEEQTVATQRGIEMEQTFERENTALLAVAVQELNVIDTMEWATTSALRAKTVAGGVQDACVGIIQAQASIRHALQMVEGIRDLKPANLDEKAEKLWECMDEGSVSIMINALAMNRVAAKYFGFFLKFKSSFQYYQANSERNLTVATQNLVTDCKAFGEFNREFTEYVDKLNVKAQRVIRKCVEDGMGDVNFRQAQEAKETRKQTYLNKKIIYDAKVNEWLTEHGIDALTQYRMTKSGNLAKAQSKIRYLTIDQQRSQDLLTKFDAQHKAVIELMGKEVDIKIAAQ